jgi:hypothetical protein
MPYMTRGDWVGAGPAAVFRRFARAAWLGLALAVPAAWCDERMPIFDAHLHYNREPAYFYSLETVLELFRRNRVTGILATSRPNDGTHALVAANPPDIRVVPFIRPYRVRSDIGSWFDDASIQELIAAEFARGGYAGIGEFHLHGRQADTPWVKRTVDFAVANGLYLHAHADDEALETLFRHNPKARIIWAHTGFGTPPEKVEAYLVRYPNLWGELSYRDGITGPDGRLSEPWRRLFERYPDRFLVGSDTWTNSRWQDYDAIIAGYRAWLAQLPRDAAEKIAFRNAERLFPRK